MRSLIDLGVLDRLNTICSISTITLIICLWASSTLWYFYEGRLYRYPAPETSIFLLLSNLLRETKKWKMLLAVGIDIA